MKYFVIAGALSLISVSAFAGVMPEELIEPTTLMMETITDSTVEATENNPKALDQFIQFAFMVLFMLLLSSTILLPGMSYQLQFGSTLCQFVFTNNTLKPQNMLTPKIAVLQRHKMVDIQLSAIKEYLTIIWGKPPPPQNPTRLLRQTNDCRR